MFDSWLPPPSAQLQLSPLLPSPVTGRKKKTQTVKSKVMVIYLSVYTGFGVISSLFP